MPETGEIQKKEYLIWGGGYLYYSTVHEAPGVTLLSAIQLSVSEAWQQVLSLLHQQKYANNSEFSSRFVGYLKNFQDNEAMQHFLGVSNNIQDARVKVVAHHI